MDKETESKKDIGNSYEYYANPVVSRIISEFCGSTDVLPNFNLIDNSNNNENFIQNEWLSEYINISNMNIARQKQGRSPARSIKPRYLPDILSWEPTTEVYMSFWQKELKKGEIIVPSRSIFLLDIEYYNKYHPELFLEDQAGVLNKMETVYKIVSNKLKSYGINFLSTLTGKGYHFLSEVPYSSDVINEVIDIGKHIDPNVRALQETVPTNSKRDRIVPLSSQQCHKGMGRIAQYFVSQVINEMRQNSSLPVEISDIGDEGISIDLTPNLIRTIDTGSIGIPGSIYLKPHVHPDIYDHGVLRRSRILTRVIRENNGKEVNNLNDLISIRQNFTKAVNDNLARTSGKIPDSPKGIHSLIDEYSKSDLKKFHDAMDSTEGDHWTSWSSTYRNYNGIAGYNQGLREIFREGSHDMLEPGKLNYVLNLLFEKWGGVNNLEIAGHIKAFLHSVYEDPRFGWGNRFTRHYSAAQHSEGWTTMILGQRFDKK